MNSATAWQYFDSPREVIAAAAVFGLVLSVFGMLAIALWQHYRNREQILDERLDITDGSAPRVLRLWHEGKPVATIVPGHSGWRDLRTRLERLPEDAGWNVPLRSVLLGLAGLILLNFAICFALGQHVMAPVVISMAILAGFSIYTRMHIDRRMARFERQFVDALQLIARSLRAGHPLVGAFRLAAEEMPSPTSRIFTEICQEQALGVALEDALRKAANVSGSSDMKLFATSIAIQIRSGGNLADMMDRLAAVIRDRIRLGQRVRVMTAQTQLSKRILLGLPIFMLGALMLLNPAHMEPLFTRPLGQYMLGGAAAGMVLGWWLMNRITQLRY
jgi:tight adherence protein B